MANSRLIASDIFEDEFYLALDMLGRNLWIGMIVRCADDQGRLQNNPILIKSQVFPADDVTTAQIESILNVFSSSDRILRYVNRGKKVIQILNWWKHQHPSWAAASRYPAPEGWTDRIKVHGKGTKVYTLNWDNPGGFALGNGLGNGLPNHELPNIPKGINDVNVNVNGEGEEGTENPSSSPASPPPFQPTDPADRVWRLIKPSSYNIPPTLRESVIPIIDAVLHRHKMDESKAAEEGKTYFDAWCKRRGKNGKYYSPNGTGWIDWWAQGEIPPKNGAGDEPHYSELHE